MLGGATKMTICNEDVVSGKPKRFFNFFFYIKFTFLVLRGVAVFLVLARDRFVCLVTLRYEQRCPILVSNVINFLDPSLIFRNLRPRRCIQCILACEEFIWLSFIGQYKRADYRMQIADWV